MAKNEGAKIRPSFQKLQIYFFSRICTQTSTVIRYTVHYAVLEVTTVDAKSHLRM